MCSKLFVLLLFILPLAYIEAQNSISKNRQHQFIKSRKLYLKHVVGISENSELKVDSISTYDVQAHPSIDFSFTDLEYFKTHTTSQLTTKLTNKDKFGFKDNTKLRKTVLGLAYMAAHAYKKLPKEGWQDIGSHWKVNSTFGWDNTTIRGYVFSNDYDNSLVVAYKGTSFSFLPGGKKGTIPNDKVSDNLMFSCCCGGTNGNWRQVCDCGREDNKCSISCLKRHTTGNATYFHGAQKIFDAVRDQYPDATYILAGHSLGGSLAALVGINSGIPAVTFEAPGERLYAERSGIMKNRHLESLLIHFGVNSDPIYMGTCNGIFSSCYFAGYGMDSICHTSDRCTFDTREELGWFQSILHHSFKPLLSRVYETWADGDAFTSNFFCSDSRNCTDCKGWEFIN